MGSGDSRFIVSLIGEWDGEGESQHRVLKPRLLNLRNGEPKRIQPQVGLLKPTSQAHSHNALVEACMTAKLTPEGEPDEGNPHKFHEQKRTPK